ncbi:FAS1 domain-containing protein [Diplogelasinospora grovesii]|uniref:FAS1 domain-containing protein n=1 Tax=Diplogelasinospora grovesii TaxID=303347 RepID=A0AAN6N329_9PEZI|nr:FAS1 domain-containing protein [Diplogelasinospora grovesii]
MMELKRLLLLAIANIVTVQSQSLSDALASQNATLSSLNKLLASEPGVVSALSSASNITVLAPSNDALTKFLNDTSVASAIDLDPGLVPALLNYHVLRGTYYASNFTDANKSLFVPTLLTNQTYSNVTSGQRVEARASNGKVTFYSGLLENSTVVTANVNFTGGTIHIIDTVLTVPPDDLKTLLAANLTALYGAISRANLNSTLSATKDVTIFAPNNAAFNAIGSVLAGIDNATLASLLGYHVVPGTVFYSDMITNTTARTLSGSDVRFTVEDGNVFVNSAKVVQPNVLVANGVVHVIDNVLNPQNTTATPDPTASTQSPAFSGASSTGGTPFTSGVPTPSSTAPVATATGAGSGGGSGGSQSTSTSSGLGVPMKTGAAGVAALFGGAAAVLLVNL